VPKDPYTDPVTGVLRNQPGLRTTGDLESAEREITHAALIFLKESPVPPGYDLGHLCAIHRRIFGDIYDWAGPSAPSSSSLPAARFRHRQLHERLPRQGRSTALFTLAAEVPAAILAKTLGIHIQAAIQCKRSPPGLGCLRRRHQRPATITRAGYAQTGPS
jgi:hypothetical protein